MSSTPFIKISFNNRPHFSNDVSAVQLGSRPYLNFTADLNYRIITCQSKQEPRDQKQDF